MPLEKTNNKRFCTTTYISQITSIDVTPIPVGNQQLPCISGKSGFFYDCLWKLKPAGSEGGGGDLSGKLDPFYMFYSLLQVFKYDMIISWTGNHDSKIKKHSFIVLHTKSIQNTQCDNKRFKQKL